MSITLRIILIIFSVIAFILCIKKMKQSKLKITDSIIWILGSIILILMSIFSNAVVWISSKLGFIAPVNFVFSIMIVFLLIETFLHNIRVSILNEKIKQLNHYIALKELEKKDNKME